MVILMSGALGALPGLRGVCERLAATCVSSSSDPSLYADRWGSDLGWKSGISVADPLLINAAPWNARRERQLRNITGAGI